MIYKSKTKEYKVIKKLGEGESGITYLVESNNKQFVLKELKILNMERWSIAERFKKEIEILKNINHKGIPKFIDIIEDSESIAYIQEYIEGKTFKEIIENKEKTSDIDFKNYFLQALDILNYLHKMLPPIIHQDISPKNIIISNKKLYLIDFGAVKTAVTGNKTQGLTTVGTLGYMAPEQIMGKAITSSDIFSLGMTFLAIKNQKKASSFEINDNTGDLNIKELLKKIPLEFKEIIKKSVLSNSKQRFKSIEEIYNFINLQPKKQKTKKIYQKKRYIIPTILLLVLLFLYIKSLIPQKDEIKKFGGWFSGHGRLIDSITGSLGNSSFFRNNNIIHDIKISHNNKYMASLSTKSLIIWDYKSSKIISKINKTLGYSIEFSKNDKFIYILASGKGKYRVFDIEKKKIIKNIDLTEILLKNNEDVSLNKIKCSGNSTKKREITCVSEDQKDNISIYLINLIKNKSEHIGNLSGAFSAKSFYIESINKFIIPIYSNSKVYPFTYYTYSPTEKSLNNLPQTKEITAMNKEALVSVKHSRAQSLYVITKDNNLNFRCTVEKTTSNKAYLSPDSKYFVLWPSYARKGGNVEIYDAQNCKPLKTIKRPAFGIGHIEIKNDLILIADTDENIRLFKIK